MTQFPHHFKFGVATSAHQIEGAWNKDGKTESIWDYQAHTFPHRISDGENADVACDSYHKLDKDIANLQRLKVHFYRFSLAWCRILPSGFPNHINQKGVDYYNNVIDKLVENNIAPHVTIYHWDLPQKLQELGGWANPRMADYFLSYARICFQLFGDRVKTWITINEPYQIAELGYARSLFAPFYHIQGIGNYLAAHTLLLAHGRAYRLYENEFKSTQQGRVGITIECAWPEPATESKEDKEAAERYLQFYFGWLVHPIFGESGDYPEAMRTRIDRMSKERGFEYSRLPKFTAEEVQMLKGATDFLGYNHYLTYYVSNDADWGEVPSMENDVGVRITFDDSWKKTSAYIFRVVPWGLRKFLKWIKDEYNNPEVQILENGYAGFSDDPINDLDRIDYLKDYLKAVLDAIVFDGCNVTAYTVWSFIDNYEWCHAYLCRFGLYHVDFKDPGRKRTPKRSAFLYQDIIATKSIPEHAPETFMH